MSVTATDLFCGAGGSATGAVEVGIDVRMAANHWPKAIETHQLNHPGTRHDCADISQVEPRRYERTDILWGSPECTNHSIAKGVARSKQAEQAGLWEEAVDADAAIRSRATMWDIPRFAEVHRYRIVITENVVDAAKWVMFPAWIQAMELLGYKYRIVWLNSMHAHLGGLPAPQSRDRMYVFFWRGIKTPNFDRLRPVAVCAEHGQVRAVQVFKKRAEWGRYRAQYVYRCPKCGTDVEPPWLPAASVIDWTNPGVRIGDRAKPLSPKTMARIQAGIDRHWGKELVVPVEGRAGKKAATADMPLRTQSTRLETALVVPHSPLVLEAAGNTYDATSPKHPGYGNPGSYYRIWPGDEALRTLHGTATKALLMPYYGKGTAAPTTDPHRTLTTTDRYALTEGGKVNIEDCMFRMLTPDEVKRGMAFPAHYQAVGTKREQVRMWGNAVTPPAARDLYTIASEALAA